MGLLLCMEAELTQQQSAIEVPLPDTSSEEEEEGRLPSVNTKQIKMSISVDFLAPKPIQDGSDLSNRWTRFNGQFDQFLTAAEKGDSAIMLRCIVPRGNDIFKSFTFTGAKSKDKYDDVVEKFDAFCNRCTNKVVKRHQLLSTKPNTMSIDEYVTSLHKIACECQLATMYDDFMHK